MENVCLPPSPGLSLSRLYKWLLRTSSLLQVCDAMLCQGSHVVRAVQGNEEIARERDDERQ